MFFLSIITPLYNRSHLIKNCYNSLIHQTIFDFEWIIIDDGSQDHPEDIISTFHTEQFPIIFIQKENAGKHTALNASHKYIHGNYVLILDSDDVLTKDAVEQCKVECEKYSNNHEVGVITFLRGRDESTPLCSVNDYETPVDIMRYKRKCIYSSDCAEVIRTSLFRQISFPVYPNEKFISECALWSRVSFTHKCVYINKVIYICEYLDGGLTKQGRALRIRNPLGGMFISNLRMNKKNYFSQRIKYGLLYTCYGFFAKKSPVVMAQQCDSKMLMWLCIPWGWALYKYWNKKFGDS